MLAKYIFKRAVFAFLDRARVFETWYKTASDEWTQDTEKANWQRFHGLSTGALMVETRYIQCWRIDSKQYDNYNNAFEAAQYEIMKPYLVQIAISLARILKKRGVIS